MVFGPGHYVKNYLKIIKLVNNNQMKVKVKDTRKFENNK